MTFIFDKHLAPSPCSLSGIRHSGGTDALTLGEALRGAGCADLLEEQLRSGVKRSSAWVCREDGHSEAAMVLRNCGNDHEDKRITVLTTGVIGGTNLIVMGLTDL